MAMFSAVVNFPDITSWIVADCIRDTHDEVADKLALEPSEPANDPDSLAKSIQYALRRYHRFNLSRSNREIQQNIRLRVALPVKNLTNGVRVKTQ